MYKQMTEAKLLQLHSLVGWLVDFNGISTSIGHLMPDPF